MQHGYNATLMQHGFNATLMQYYDATFMQSYNATLTQRVIRYSAPSIGSAAYTWGRCNVGANRTCDRHGDVNAIRPCNRVQRACGASATHTQHARNAHATHMRRTGSYGQSAEDCLCRVRGDVDDVARFGRQHVRQDLEAVGVGGYRPWPHRP